MKDTILKYKGYFGSVEIDTEENVIWGKLLFIKDLVTYEAETVGQIKKEFELAVDDYLDMCKQLGDDPLKPLTGSFNVRVGSELHRQLMVYALEHHVSNNEVVKRALSQYLINSDNIA